MIHIFLFTLQPWMARCCPSGDGQGRGILGVVDGVKTKGIETEADIKTRKEFLRKI